MKTVIDEKEGVAYCDVESKDGSYSCLYKIYEKDPYFVYFIVPLVNFKAYKNLLGSIGDIMGRPEIHVSQAQEIASVKQRMGFFDIHKELIEEVISREDFKIRKAFKIVDCTPVLS